MTGNMRILVSVPSISYIDAAANEMLLNFFFEEVQEFTPSPETTLGVFSLELPKVPMKSMFGINIPDFGLQINKAKGVAGPGLPQDELFYPQDLEKAFKPICGKYDKWRPYPAEEPLSDYAIKLAHRFTNKRCKMFEYAARKLSWDTLFYVEHSPISLAHLDRAASVDVAEKVFSYAIKACREWPSIPLVLFSPYGNKGEPGFSISRNVVAPVTDWKCVREYLNRE